MTAETFEEVLQIAVDVYNFSNETEQVAELPVPNSSEKGETDEDQEQESEEQNEEQSQESMPQGSQQPQSSPEFDEDEEEEEEDEELEGTSGGEQSKTQRSFDSSSENLSSRTGRNSIYIEIPEKIDIDNHLVDWSILHEWIDVNQISAENYESVDAEYTQFRKQSQKEVNYLVKEFECRKSADAYARASQSKTGVLDTTKLHTYKYNDDIFKKVTVIPDGKNHGLLFLLDWSGSMSNEILATVKQVLNLTAFCKKVQIPFEVYAFTNEWVAAKRSMAGDNGYIDYDYKGLEKNKVYINQEFFHMMNFVSSRSNSKDYERMCLNLFREAYYYTHHVSYNPTFGVGLSGTPLNEAIVMLNYIIPQFKQMNDLQKVNVCILSDGESGCAAYGHEIYLDHKDEFKVAARRIDWYQVLRDRKTGRTYPQFDGENVTNIFIQQVRDRNPGVNVIGFRILAGSQLTSFVGRYANFDGYSEVQKQWKKEKSAIISNPIAFTALYAISNSSLDENAEFDVESGAKKGEISRAFKKMLSKKATNKKLLNSFVEYIA